MAFSNILINGGVHADVQEWQVLNTPWLIEMGASLYWLDTVRGPRAVASVAPDGSILDTEISSFADAPLIVAKSSWIAPHGWTIPLDIICDEMRIKSATGRLLKKQLDPAGRVLFTDQTPAMIADHVIKWNVTSSIHAIACSRLPLDFLWISAAKARECLFNLDVDGSLEKAVEGIFLDDGLQQFGLNVYLPDIQLQPK